MVYAKDIVQTHDHVLLIFFFFGLNYFSSKIKMNLTVEKWTGYKKKKERAD